MNVLLTKTATVLILLSTMNNVSAQDIDQGTIGLDALIRAVVNDVTSAANAPSNLIGGGGQAVFDLGETHLELQFTLSRDAGGKLEANFLGFGGAGGVNISDQKTQKISIKLIPSTSGTEGIQFSSFDPAKPTVLLDSASFARLNELGAASPIRLGVPTAINAEALGIANEGVVLNADTYRAWLDVIEQANPQADLAEFATTPLQVELPSQTLDVSPRQQ
ncbi:hypothetical protein PZ895_08770 [Mesorhizobium sp. YIM 152430]|uniref:trypco2 family protein n=1 Tax=Mesorhizobium sp. YIM 152430 TaxID=3031761 RepID=UPI0023DABF2C|nr:trypco2 family protein [Mesorhizobium sp. YIM 152430]MDF1599870.1 hypothetical protein [Mesorhizobium sp. YIM 152430]